MRILIVDDEDTIRERLVRLEEWSDAGCEVVGEASNGLEALAAIPVCKPDLILTDIRMPEMDGIELSEKVRREFPSIKIVFLTAYSDFSYAQQAVKLGIADFITKPVNVAELMDAVESMRANKDEEEERRSAFRENVIERLLSGEWTSFQQVEWLRLHGLHVRSVIVIRVEVDNIDLLHGMGRPYSLTSMKDNILYTLGYYASMNWTYLDLRGMYILLFQNDDATTALYDDSMRIARDVLDSVKNAFPFSVSIGVSSVLRSLSELPQGWDEVKQCLEYRMLLDRGSIISMNALQSLRADEHAGEQAGVQEFHKVIRKADAADISPYLRSVYKEMLSRGMNKIHIEKNVLTLIDQAEKLAEEYALPVSKEHFTRVRKKALSYDILGDLMKYLEQELLSIVKALRNTLDNSERGTVSRVRAYIETQFMNEVSLFSLADELHMSHAHLSRLIKKETGSNFRDLLARKRIECAKTLLMEDRLKSYEIAYEIGFKSPAHFSLLFSKMVGVNPTEYKDTATRKT